MSDRPATFGSGSVPPPPASSSPSVSQQQPVASSSSSRTRRQRPVTYCLPPSSWAANVTEDDAQLSLHKLVAAQSQRQGFDAASSSALHELSHLTERFMLSIFAAASHGAELANRGSPSARDLIYSLETHGLPIAELRHFARDQEQQAAPPSQKAQGKARATFPAPTARSVEAAADHQYGWTDPTSAFLPSDSDTDEQSDAWSVSSESDGGGSNANRRAALAARVQRRQQRIERAEAKRRRREQRMASDPTGSGLDVSALQEGERAWKRIADHVVPKHLPGRPPRHCWVETAAYPPNAYSSGGPGGSTASNPLVLVNRKLANARLVEASLRRLIQNTDSQVGGQPSPRSGDSPYASAAEPSSSSAAAAGGHPSDGVFATPKLPSRASLTLRLKNKVSAPATPASILGVDAPPPMMTPLPLSRSRRGTLTSTPSGFPMLDPLLASPMTPAGGIGGPMTPYPPTPSSTAFGGQYFGSQAFGWNQRASFSDGAAGAFAVPRSRTASMAGLGVGPGGAGKGGADVDEQAEAGLPLRMPGAVNYKNVWYAPGSAGSGGAEAGSGGGANRGAKRMRKWKV
ncbi:uncharacterized protein PFL1_04623 [Pseudozyma flocculosa PF-1]|uniref:Transcription initiation factor TFIID subunit 8 n=1 Tax=Pseudozyma flocculosa PF-1 TaxID=1277687 RepID=A0A061H5Y4_9BASI|nr:uncharacterized protein PFL1_04623 [Pseudozyma flocculosa PF-1]EPQ27879.1 hypothetical protein PFL1_04623 [Pseudozyma flocculosa PF-1]